MTTDATGRAGEGGGGDDRLRAAVREWLRSDNPLADLLAAWEELPGRDRRPFLAALQAEAPELAREFGRVISDVRALDDILAAQVEPGGAPRPPGEAVDAVVRLDRFRPLLAQGEASGQGDLFLAVDRISDRLVVVKLPQRDSPAARARFRREVNLTSRLEHPGIPPVYAAGEAPDGRPFYAMRYVEGETLERAVASHHAGPPGPDRAAGLRELVRRLVAVCETVAYANGRGVLHRDLKPQNVVLGGFGETVVLDWGLGKALASLDPDGGREEAGGDGLETAAAVRFGTPGYASPEQYHRTAAVDQRSEVYSLGATLYQLLTGRRPVPLPEGADVEAAARLHPLPEPGEPGSGVPPSLADVCRRGMHPDPDRRHPTVAEFGGDLRAWLDDRPVDPATRRDAPAERAARWVRRHTAAAVAAGAAVVLGTLAVASVLLLRAAAEARAREHARSTEMEARSNLDRGLFALEGDDPLSALPWLGHAYQIDRDERRPVDTHRLRLGVTASAVPAFTRSRVWRVDSPEAVRLSPDGRHVAVGGRDGLVRVFDAASGGPVTPGLAHPRALVTAVEFSPDGKTLASGDGEGVVRLWSTADWSPRAAPVRLAPVIQALRFAPDSKLVAASSGTGEVGLWNAGDGRAVGKPIRPGTSAVSHLAFADGGRRLVTASEKELRLWDASTGGPVGEPWVVPGWVRFLAVSPDGRTVAVAADDGELALVDARTGKVGPKRLRTGLEESPEAAAFSPDGGYVALAGEDARTRAKGGGEVRVIAARGGDDLVAPVPQEGKVQRLAFSPDGSRLLVVSKPKAGGGAVQVWDLTAGSRPDDENRQAPRALPLGPAVVQPDEVTAAEFAGDGRRLLVASGLRYRTLPVSLSAVVTVDALTGRRLAGPFAGRADDVQISDDGRTVLTRLVRPRGAEPPEVPGGEADAPADFQVWDALTGRPLGSPLPADRATGVQGARRDGLRIALTGRARSWGVENRPVDAPPARVWTVGRGDVAEVRPEEPFNGTAALSAGGSTLVTASVPLFTPPPGAPEPPPGRLRFWDAETGRPAGPGSPVRGLVAWLHASPDGRRATVGGWHPEAGGKVLLGFHDSATGAVTEAELLPGLNVIRSAFSDDGKYLALGESDGAVSLWDTVAGQRLARSDGHAGGLTGAAFDPAARLLLTTGRDGAARVWEVPSLRPVGAPRPHDGRLVGCLLTEAPEGLLAVTAAETGSEGGAFHVWAAETGETLGPPRPYAGRLAGLVNNPLGPRAAVLVGGDQETPPDEVWLLDETAGGSRTVELLRTEARETVDAVALAPDGGRVVLAGGSNERSTLVLGPPRGLVEAFDPSTGESTGPPAVLPRRVRALAVGRGGDRALVLTGGPFERRDVRALNWPSLTPAGPAVAVGEDDEVAFSPDARLVAVATGRRAAGPVPSLRLIDPATGASSAARPLAGGQSHRVAFTPDGRAVLTVSSGVVELWPVAGNAPAEAPAWRVTEPTWPDVVAFSPDGSRLVTAGARGARLRDAATGAAVGPPLSPGVPITSAAFSADGRLLLLVGADRTAQAWRVGPRPEPAGPALRSAVTIQAAELAPAGGLALAVTDDGAVRVWDVVSGDPVAPPLRHGGEVAAARFLPDGRRVAVATAAGRAWVWDLSAVHPDGPAGEGRLLLASGRTLDDFGQPRRLGRDELLRAAKQAGEADAPPDPAAADAWHLRRAAAAVAFPGLSLESEAWARKVALWHLDRLVSRRPRSASLLAARAKIRDEGGDREGAVKDAEAALKLRPDDWSLALLRAETLNRLGRAAEAAEADRQAEAHAGAAWWLWFRRGLARARANDNKGAEAAYDRAVTLEPDAWVARIYRADLRRLRGALGDADADFSEVIKANPSLWQAWHFRGVTRQQMARDRGGLLVAMKDYDAAVGRGGGSTSQRARADLAVRLGDWTTARNALESLANDRPDDLDLATRLGEAYVREGKDPGRAVDLLSKVTEQRPRSAQAWTLLGLARLRGRKAEDEALSAFSRAIASDPNAWEALAERGQIHFQRGDWRAAADDLSRAGTGLPDRPGLRGQLALAFALNGNSDRALALVGPVLTASPDDPDALAARALARSARGEYQAALADLDRAAKADPKRGRLRLYRGLVLDAAGRALDAVPEYQAALRADRSDRWAALRLAQSYVTATLFERAVEVALNAPHDDAGSRELTLLLGDVYARQGKWDLAASAFRAAADQRPGAPDAWARLGRAEGERLRLDEALPAYDRALAAAPGDAALRLERADVRLALGRWADAATDLEARLESAPDELGTRNRLAYAYARLGQWDRADAQTVEVRRRNPDEFAHAFIQGLIRAAAGNAEGYRETCREAVAKFGRAGSPHLTQLARLVTLRPDASDLAGDLDRLLQEGPKETEVARQAARGRLATRAGRNGEAVRLFGAVIKGGPPPVRADLYLMGLAGLATGQLEGARLALQVADQSRPDTTPPRVPPGRDRFARDLAGWMARVEFDQLRKELADALARKPAPAPGPAPPPRP